MGGFTASRHKGRFNIAVSLSLSLWFVGVSGARCEMRAKAVNRFCRSAKEEKKVEASKTPKELQLLKQRDRKVKERRSVFFFSIRGN